MGLAGVTGNLNLTVGAAQMYDLQKRVSELEAQNAALRAERNELSSKLEVERFVTDAMHRLAKAAEAERDALRAKVDTMIDAATVQKMLDDAQPIMAEACRGYEEANADLQARLTAAEAERDALRAERDELSDKLELERALTDGAHRRARAAEAAAKKLRAERDDALTFLDNAVSKAPEPLKALGKYLAGRLDEDEWPTAEQYLNAAAKACADRAEAAEAQIAALTARVERLTGVAEVVSASFHQLARERDLSETELDFMRRVDAALSATTEANNDRQA